MCYSASFISLPRTDSPRCTGKLNLVAFVVENVCRAQLPLETSQACSKATGCLLFLDAGISHVTMHPLGWCQQQCCLGPTGVGTAGSPGSTLDLAGRESEQGSDMLNRSQRSAGRGRCQDLNTNPILKAMYFIQNCVWNWRQGQQERCSCGCLVASLLLALLMPCLTSLSLF